MCHKKRATLLACFLVDFALLLQVETGNQRSYKIYKLYTVVLVVQRFGFGLVIERSLVRLPAGALSSQLGQLSLPSLLGR